MPLVVFTPDRMNLRMIRSEMPWQMQTLNERSLMITNDAIGLPMSGVFYSMSIMQMKVIFNKKV